MRLSVIAWSGLIHCTCSLTYSHDHRGELYRVNWSHFGRDSHLDCDIENIEELYKAMRTFDDIMNDPKNHIRLKMQPGKLESG